MNGLGKEAVPLKVDTKAMLADCKASELLAGLFQFALFDCLIYFYGLSILCISNFKYEKAKLHNTVT